MLGTVGLWSESNAAFDWALEQFPGEGFIASTAIGKAIEAADWSRVDLLAARGGDRGLYADYIAGILRIADRLANGTLNAKRVLEVAERQLAETGSIGLRPLGFLGPLGLADEVYDLIALADFSYLEQPNARPLGDDMGLHLLFDVGWRSLRQDRRFVELCAGLGFCDYWARSGKWPDWAAEVGAYDFRADARAANATIAARDAGLGRDPSR